MESDYLFFGGLMGFLAGMTLMIVVFYSGSIEPVSIEVFDNICKEKFGENYTWLDTSGTEDKVSCKYDYEQTNSKQIKTAYDDD